MSDSLIKALELAVSHIEHMAAWIGEQRRGYSFESLGEDMPGIKAALSASTNAAPIAWMLRAERASHTRSARQYGDRRVLCGQVFMSDGTARAAAKRQTNRWRKIEAFPVYDHGAPAHSPAAAQAKLPGDGTISDQAILDHRLQGPYFQYRQTPSWAGSCTCGETFFADSSGEVARKWATHVSEAISALPKEPKQ